MGCDTSVDATFNEPLDEELEHELNFTGFNKTGDEVDRFQSNKPQQGFDAAFFEPQEEADQQFMAVKPWIGALKAPTNPPPVNNQAPQKCLKLQFINGFAVEDSRQNCFWGKNKDQIIFPAAAIGVVMNVNTLKQKFMGTGVNSQANGHTDNIVSLGVDPNRKRVVTGSIGARPLILVWDSDTMQIIARANLARNTRAVSTIRFSRDGKNFFCTDKHNDSNVYCFDAASGTLIGQNKCGSDPVFDADAGDHGTFAVATKRGMWFFQQNGSGLDQKKGIFNGQQMTSMITVTYNYQAKCFYSGTATGYVYQWEGNTCTKTQKRHQGSIMALTFAAGKLLSSGSKDSLIKISQNGQIIKEISIQGFAKSLDLFNGRVLATTKYGQILSIDQNSGASNRVLKGHWTGQVWGLSIGSDGKVYTTADDNHIICFNPSTSKVQKTGVISNQPGKIKKILGASTLSLLAPNKQSRAIALNQAGHVAIGTNQGTLSVRTTADLSTEVYNLKVSKEWIEVIKYSPDESKLAVGSHDNNIYIFSVSGSTYSLDGKLKGHNSFITNLDWSKDGRFIQSNCGAYQLLFFNVQNLSQIQGGASQLRDEKWATYTVKLGWYVQGIFPPATDGSHVNGVDRNKAEDVIATGDDWGFVNFYGNPNTKGAKCKAYRGHSSHVVRVQFDKSDSYVYSIGGYDKTLMKWKVV